MHAVTKATTRAAIRSVLCRPMPIACLAATLTACAPLPTRGIVSSYPDALTVERHALGPPSASGFSVVYGTPTRREETLDLVWHTVEDEYYDPHFTGIDLAALEARSRAELADVHSDADFYRVVQSGVAAMHDSHTGVLTPLEAEDERAQRATRIGLGYEIVDDRVVIREVLPGSAAEEAGVRRGMIIESIDGHALDATFLQAAARQADAGSSTRVAQDATGVGDPAAVATAAHDAVDDAVQRRLEAVSALLDAGDREPAPHRVTLRRADDTLLAVELLARMQDFPPVAHYTLRPSGVGVLRLSRFDPSLLPELESEIDAAGDDSRALIIDLRDDPGGETDMMQRVLERFIERPTSLGSFRVRLWRWTLALDVRGTPAGHPYLKPLAVLIDGATGSAAEWAAHALVELRDAIAVGESTCGCVVAIRREFLLPDGGVLRVAEAGAQSPHGRRMENDPLVPTLAVAPTLADLRADQDVVLEAAEHALLAR